MPKSIVAAKIQQEPENAVTQIDECKRERPCGGCRRGHSEAVEWARWDRPYGVGAYAQIHRIGVEQHGQKNSRIGHAGPQKKRGRKTERSRLLSLRAASLYLQSQQSIASERAPSKSVPTPKFRSRFPGQHIFGGKCVGFRKGIQLARLESV